MASLDLLERMLLKFIAKTDPVRLKRQRMTGTRPQENEEEQRMRIRLLLRRLDKLPADKREEVLDLLRRFHW